MQLEIEQKAFYKGWNYIVYMILLSSYQYIRQIFKTSEIVSITAKKCILKGIQDKNSAG